MASVTSSSTDRYATGTLPGAGTFFCLECGSHLFLDENDSLPDCPRCGASFFRRDSIFESMQDHGEATDEFAVPGELAPPGWLDEARARLPRAGRYLAYRDEESGDDEPAILPLKRGWTRIGRSVAAHVRLDDPSVSRRHALIVSEPEGSLRVLDDRSLNGVFLNGELIEGGKLENGDELRIGRFRIFILEA